MIVIKADLARPNLHRAGDPEVTTLSGPGRRVRTMRRAINSLRDETSRLEACEFAHRRRKPVPPRTHPAWLVVLGSLTLALATAAAVSEAGPNRPSVAPEILDAMPPPPPGLVPEAVTEPDNQPGVGVEAVTWAHDSGLEGDEPLPGGTPYHDYANLQNYLIVEVSDFPGAASAVASIQLNIGTFVVNLLAPAGGFLPGEVLKYDFNLSSCPSCWNNMNPDNWDSIVLSTTSGDGLHVKDIMMVHSSMTVIDATVDAWIDRYYGTKLDLSIDNAMKRLESVLEGRRTALFYASQDLGQAGAQKYVSVDTAWCSEFTSWALRQAGLGTPTGSIYVGTMETYFSGAGRYYTKAQVDAGAYMPQAGDYMSVNSRGHSVLFLGWSTPVGGVPTNTDRFYTIEGNNNNAVVLSERTWSTVDFVGRAE